MAWPVSLRHDYHLYDLLHIEAAFLRAAAKNSVLPFNNYKEAHGEFESECPGYCGAQDTFYVGTLKGVGRIYQQSFIDTYAKVAFAKLYDRKTPITAAEILNDRVVPFYDEHGDPAMPGADRPRHRVLRHGESHE